MKSHFLAKTYAKSIYVLIGFGNEKCPPPSPWATTNYRGRIRDQSLIEKGKINPEDTYDLAAERSRKWNSDFAVK